MGAEQVARGWAGIDVGKAHHWVCLIDEAGSTLWSSKVVNDCRRTRETARRRPRNCPLADMRTAH